MYLRGAIYMPRFICPVCKCKRTEIVRPSEKIGRVRWHFPLCINCGEEWTEDETIEGLLQRVLRIVTGELKESGREISLVFSAVRGKISR